MKGIFSFSREKTTLIFKAPALYIMTLMPDVIFRRWMSRYDGVVLIYQMGKVASSTIYASLKQDPRLLVLHFHRMPGPNRESTNKRLGLTFRLRTLLHDLQGTTGYRLMRRFPEKTFLISLVRDPFSRNISGYFQNLWRHGADGNVTASEDHVQDVIRSIVTDYDHDVPLRWFEDEFRPATGIDVYDVPFDAFVKAGLSRDTKYPLLILRTDLADKTKLTLLRTFLNRPDLTLQQSNTGETKFYADLYRAVKSEFKYPAEYVDQALGSKLMQHFFTRDERRELGLKYGASESSPGDAE
ncbi:Sulfotransferase family protein [Roseicitreum antarcticum]|uniref:Sulfotransferase family protein n=2 Tax=Roseicitreum antarcticum TaxID=564137 RepID=A0A1H3CPN3_9RHOB|nr:Sulfotransferase family protein [Roseicitreum antarcticum]